MFTKQSVKRLTAAALCLFCLLSFAACGTGKTYEKSSKEFTSNGMTIKLTDAFKTGSYEGYTAVYEASDALVFALRESFDVCRSAGINSISDYTAAVLSANSSRNPSEVTTEDGLSSFEYSFYNSDYKMTYKYLSYIFEGSDAYWMIQFACAESKYDEFKPHFVDWAKSVTFA